MPNQVSIVDNRGSRVGRSKLADCLIRQATNRITRPIKRHYTPRIAQESARTLKYHRGSIPLTFRPIRQ